MRSKCCFALSYFPLNDCLCTLLKYGATVKLINLRKETGIYTHCSYRSANPLPVPAPSTISPGDNNVSGIVASLGSIIHQFFIFKSPFSCGMTSFNFHNLRKFFLTSFIISLYLKRSLTSVIHLIHLNTMVTE